MGGSDAPRRTRDESLEALGRGRVAVRDGVPDDGPRHRPLGGGAEGTAQLALQTSPSTCETGLTYDTEATLDTGPDVVDYVSVAGVTPEMAFVTWVEENQTTGDMEVRGQPVDEESVAVSGEDALISDLTGDQIEVSTSAYSGTTANRIVVAWSGYNTTTSSYDIRARIFTWDAGGYGLVSNGGYFVADDNDDRQFTPQAQFLWQYPSYRIAYVWEDWDHDRLEYRLCNLTGSCVSVEQELTYDNDGTNETPRLDAFPPSIGTMEEGFVAVWSSDRLLDGDGTADDNIYFRRFDADGDPLDAADILVSANDGTDDVLPDVAVTDEGFVVTWQVGTGGTTEVRLRFYDYAGSAETGILEPDDLSITPGTNPRYPRVAAYRSLTRFAWVWNAYVSGDWVLQTARISSTGSVGDVSNSEDIGSATQAHDVDGMQCNSFVQGYFVEAGATDEVHSVYPSL